MPRLDKHTLRTLGFALIIVGFLLLLITLLGTTIYNCPINGCAAAGSPWIGVSVFFFSIALIILGITLLIFARRMKPEQGTDAPSVQAPANGNRELHKSSMRGTAGFELPPDGPRLDASLSGKHSLSIEMKRASRT